MVNGKWYIGKTSDVFTRYAQYKEGNVSAWTRIHKPIKVHFSYEQKSPFDEDKTTKEYMAKYGIENVRGGAFVRPTLPDNVVQELQREIWMATDCCFHCGSPDHFGKHCPTPTLESTEPQTIHNKQCETTPKQLSSHTTPDSISKQQYECAWCTKVGHSISKCPSRCLYCGYIGHKPVDCWKRCYLCNTLGHIASECVLCPHMNTD